MARRQVADSRRADGCVYIYICTRVYKYMCMHVDARVCACVCTCIYRLAAITKKQLRTKLPGIAAAKCEALPVTEGVLGEGNSEYKPPLFGHRLTLGVRTTIWLWLRVTIEADEFILSQWHP